MNIFIIHSGVDMASAKEKALQIMEINDENSYHKKANVLFLKYRRIWKPEAKRRMKAAQIVLYIVGKDGHKSKNIDWEIRQAQKLKKAIVIWNEGGYELNGQLYVNDPFAKSSELQYKQITTIQELYEIIEDYENGRYIHLFNVETIEPEKLFEQYKLFSDTSETLVARRQNVNSFFITANTALITIAASVFAFEVNLLVRALITMVLTIPGFLMNSSWIKVLDSYSLLNSSKMKILGLLEKKLQASLFEAEWEVMDNKYNVKRYVSFADRERRLPKIFNLLFAAIDVGCVMLLAWSVYHIMKA